MIIPEHRQADPTIHRSGLLAGIWVFVAEPLDFMVATQLGNDLLAADTVCITTPSRYGVDATERALTGHDRIAGRNPFCLPRLGTPELPNTLAFVTCVLYHLLTPTCVRPQILALENSIVTASSVEDGPTFTCNNRLWDPDGVKRSRS